MLKKTKYNIIHELNPQGSQTCKKCIAKMGINYQCFLHTNSLEKKYINYKNKIMNYFYGKCSTS